MQPHDTPATQNANHRKGRGLDSDDVCCIQVVITTGMRKRIRETGLLFRDDELNRSEVVRVALGLGLAEIQRASQRGASFASLLEEVP